LWIVFALLGIHHGGLLDETPLRWLPSCALSEWLILGRRNPAAAAWALALSITFAAMTLSPPPWPTFASALILFIVGPLPFHVLDLTRRDQMLKGRQIIFYAPKEVLHTATTRCISAKGNIQEDFSEVVFFISEEDWRSMPVARKDDRTFLEQYHVAGGLYRAKATNQFNQLFDSLKLYPFLLHPGNIRAMQAVEDAFRHYFQCAPSPQRVLTGNSRPVSDPKPATANHPDNFVSGKPQGAEEDSEPDDFPNGELVAESEEDKSIADAVSTKDLVNYRPSKKKKFAGRKTQEFKKTSSLGLYE